METKEARLHRFSPFLAFALSFLVILTIYILIGITPFGERSFMVSDMYSQYSAFLGHFKDVFEHGGSIAFAPEMSLGLGSFGLWAYYLMSPFNFIVLLFKKTDISQAVSVIIALKLSASAMTAAVYLRQKSSSILTISALSLAWSLNGYVTIYAINIMWLDAVIMLPLIVLGIENIVSNRSSALYIISLSATIIFNYYIGYMVCIFCVLWFVANVFSEQREPRKITLSSARFAIASLLSGGISGIVIIPLIFTLKDGKSTPPKLENYIPLILLVLTLILSIIMLFLYMKRKAASTKSSLLSGILAAISVGANIVLLAVNHFRIDSGNISMLFIGSEHGSDLPGTFPMIYCGVGVLILSVMFFIDRSIPVRRRVSCGIVLFVLVMSTMIPSADLVWHAFNAPTWFICRYSFLIIFTLISIAAEVNNVYEKWSFPVILVSILAMLSLGDSSRFTVLFVTINVVAISLFALALYIRKSTILYILTIFELAFSANVTFDRLSNIWTTDTLASRIENNIYKVDSMLQELNKIDPGTYRVENTGALTLNDSLMLGYKGVSHYSSANSKKIISLLTGLGFTSTNAWVNYREGTTSAADCLLGIKYLLAEDSDYDLLVKGQMTDLYKNENALSLAIYSVGELPYDLNGNPFERLEAAYEAICGKNMNLFDSIPAKSTLNKHEMQLEFNLNSAENLYLWFDIPIFQVAEISVNGSDPEPCLDMTTRRVMRVSCSPGHNIFKISSDNELSISDFALYRENKTSLSAAKQLLKELEVDIQGSKIKIANNGGSGTILLTIPYSGAFEISGDGKPIVAREVLGGFISFETSGEENIELTYRLPGRKLGFSVTALSILAAIVYTMFEKCKLQRV